MVVQRAPCAERAACLFNGLLLNLGAAVLIYPVIYYPCQNSEVAFRIRSAGTESMSSSVAVGAFCWPQSEEQPRSGQLCQEGRRRRVLASTASADVPGIAMVKDVK